MKDRLQKFLTAEGLSPTKLADEIGVQRSSISHLLSGRNKPGFDFIYKFCLRYSQINVDWLITGRGSMYHKEIPAKPSEKTVSIENKSFENSNLETKQTTRFTDVNKAKRVLVFYSDGTFEDFTSR